MRREAKYFKEAMVERGVPSNVAERAANGISRAIRTEGAPQFMARHHRFDTWQAAQAASDDDLLRIQAFGITCLAAWKLVRDVPPPPPELTPEERFEAEYDAWVSA